jgi:hypothetical protein
MDSSALEEGSSVGFCEHGNESSIKGEEIID